MSKHASIEQQFVQEIGAIPDEYLPNLLEGDISPNQIRKIITEEP